PMSTTSPASAWASRPSRRWPSRTRLPGSPRPSPPGCVSSPSRTGATRRTRTCCAGPTSPSPRWRSSTRPCWSSGSRRRPPSVFRPAILRAVLWAEGDEQDGVEGLLPRGRAACVQAEHPGEDASLYWVLPLPAGVDCLRLVARQHPVGRHVAEPPGPHLRRLPGLHVAEPVGTPPPGRDDDALPRRRVELEDFQHRPVGPPARPPAMGQQQEAVAEEPAEVTLVQQGREA